MSIYIKNMEMPETCEIVCGPETNCQYADCRGKILNWLRQEGE